MSIREVREHALLIWLIVTLLVGAACELGYLWSLVAQVHIHFGT